MTLNQWLPRRMYLIMRPGYTILSYNALVLIRPTCYPAGMESHMPTNSRTGETRHISLVEDLADVLTRMVIGTDLQFHPDVERVAERYRAWRKAEEEAATQRSCAATTRKNRPCAVQPEPGKELCHLHDPDGKYQRNLQHGRDVNPHIGKRAQWGERQPSTKPKSKWNRQIDGAAEQVDEHFEQYDGKGRDRDRTRIGPFD